MRKKTVITEIIGVDCHVIGLRILEHALREAGFEIVGLGTKASQEKFTAVTVEAHTGTISVPSIYSLEESGCKGFRRKCEETGLGVYCGMSREI